MDRLHDAHRRWLRPFMLASSLLAVLMLALPVSARADLVRTEPAPNTSLGSGPPDIRLFFSGPVDPARSAITIYSVDHQRVDGGDTHLAPNDPTALAVTARDLPKGFFTVAWHVVGAGDGAASGGAFAFAVDPAQAPPSVVRQPQPTFAHQPLARVIPKWLAFLGIVAFVGGLALRFLVWRPVLRRASASGSDATVRARSVDRWLLILAGGAMLLFLPATVMQLAWEAGNAAKRPFSSSFDVGFLRAFLGSHGAGNLWAVRLLLTAVAALVVLPAAASALRRATPLWQRPPWYVDLAMLVGLLCGVSELLVRTLPARVAPGGMPRAVFTLLLDWGHLSGASVWIGGLIGLVATTPQLRAPIDGQIAPLAAVLRQFSLVALVCVGVMTLTGLWTGWIHVGGVHPLFTTLYGRTLLVKLCLVLTLVGLGAVNLLWFVPRLEAIRMTGDSSRSRWMIALGQFRRMVAIEVLVGIGILLIVPFLASSARSQAAQLRAADLSRTTMAGDLVVTLTPSALQPGLIDYDVSVSAAHDVTRVALGFASPDLGIPATEVVAMAQGDGRYRVAGLYTAIVGPWQAHVTVQQAGAQAQVARFDLPISAKPATAPALPPPRIRGTTWAYGSAAVGLVALLLAAGALCSRRASSRIRRSAAAHSVPAYVPSTDSATLPEAEA